jgi:hypothetical protein
LRLKERPSAEAMRVGVDGGGAGGFIGMVYTFGASAGLVCRSWTPQLEVTLEGAPSLG